jgi:hypothetical protein
MPLFVQHGHHHSIITALHWFCLGAVDSFLVWVISAVLPTVASFFHTNLHIISFYPETALDAVAAARIQA